MTSSVQLLAKRNKLRLLSLCRFFESVSSSCVLLGVVVRRVDLVSVS